jgi:hypothetical protein
MCSFSGGDISAYTLKRNSIGRSSKDGMLTGDADKFAIEYGCVVELKS